MEKDSALLTNYENIKSGKYCLRPENQHQRGSKFCMLVHIYQLFSVSYVYIINKQNSEKCVRRFLSWRDTQHSQSWGSISATNISVTWQ